MLYQANTEKYQIWQGYCSQQTNVCLLSYVLCSNTASLHTRTSKYINNMSDTVVIITKVRKYYISLIGRFCVLSMYTYLPVCSFHCTTNLSTAGDADSTVQAIFTLRLWISSILKFWGVGGGSKRRRRGKIPNYYHYSVFYGFYQSLTPDSHIDVETRCSKGIRGMTGISSRVFCFCIFYPQFGCNSFQFANFRGTGFARQCQILLIVFGPFNTGKKIYAVIFNNNNKKPVTQFFFSFRIFKKETWNDSSYLIYRW